MERVQKCINETGMEKVTGKHSGTISDEKINRILTEYFSKKESITRPILQSICSLTRYMATILIKKLTEEGKLINIGFKNHPLYVPTSGYFGTDEKRVCQF